MSIRTGKSISLDNTIWNDIDEYAKENDIKDFSEAAEELLREGINIWKNKKKK